jgi:DNA polymerase-3 subunit delta
MYYIFYGDEEFTRSEEVAKLKAHIMSDGMGDLNITVLDGRKASLDGVVTACSTLPFLTSRRLVIVENLLQRFDPRERASDKSEVAAEAEPAEKLAAYLLHLPPTTRLLFVENNPLSPKNPILKGAQQTKDAYIREFKTSVEGELQNWLLRRAKEKGASMGREAASLLISFVGHDLRLLDQELEKLAALANYARPIMEADIRALVSPTYEDDIFALVDSFGLRDREGAMQQLQRLLANGANELYLLTMIARQFRQILAVKDLAEEGRLNLKEIRRELHISHDFIVEKLLRQGRQFEMAELEAILGKVLGVDQAIKTGRIEGRLALELLVVDLCHRRAGGLAHSYQGKSRSRTR